jgi:hypothetical protein
MGEFCKMLLPKSVIFGHFYRRLCIFPARRPIWGSFQPRRVAGKKIVAELGVVRRAPAYPRRDVFYFRSQVSIRCAPAPVGDIFDNLAVDARRQRF